MSSATVECDAIRRIERSLAAETLGQIRVGDEELTPSDCVSLAGADHLLGLLNGKSLIGDINAAKSPFEGWTDTWLGAVQRFTYAQKCDFPAASLGGDIPECLGRIRIGNTM